MPSYYNRVFGNLYPGGIAKSEDVNMIQTNTSDAIKSVINDHHEHTAFILGDKEDAFKLTPAPKRLGRYIDTMNLVSLEDGKWLSIRKWGYRQRIKKGKTSLYSIICKFKNLSSQPVTVWCRLQDINETTLKRTSIEIPANTESSEFEIIFDQSYCSTAPGLDHNELEPFDSKYTAPPPKDESFDQGVDHTNEQDINNFTIGASELYFVIEPLYIDETDIAINGDEYDVITDETFAVLADRNGSYGKLLEQTGGLSYTETEYDLFFKDVYATTSTYLCEMGEAVIDGQKVKCMDTHISIAGANEFGHVKTFVYMDVDGHLKAINSDAFLDENEDLVSTPLPGAMLPIAIITTYMNDDKQPKVFQDDTSLIVRPRSHHERLRRVEKQIKYTNDIAIPPRLKYTLSGEDLVDPNPEGEVEGIDTSKYYLTTDPQGNFVIKNVEAKTLTTRIFMKGETEIKDAKGDELLGRFSEVKEMDIDKEKGTLKLKLDTTKLKSATGTTDEEAKETEYNPWDDEASNRPKNTDITPTEREYSVTKGKNGKNDWSSEFPAMTLYIDKPLELKGLQIPITKFKNCESIKFIIYKRQGPNNKTNTVWLEKKVYTSESFSLENAKEKDGYQIMEDGFTIEIKEGLSGTVGQYVIICIPTPKEGKGSCYVETYKPDNPRDFCIRYYGAADASHFLLKERYHEIWYNSATIKGIENKYAAEGSVISGTATWVNEEPIQTITASANITTPENCSYELYGDTGGGFQELKLDEATTMTGGGTSFKWKLVFKGDQKNSPLLEYNKDKDYAIKFFIVRRKPPSGSYSDSNDCITTKVIRGEDILREYIGDPNFNLDGNRFSNYEFARMWATDVPSNRLLIDIAASDRKAKVKIPVKQGETTVEKEVETDVYSLFYCDLTLDDFDVESVDYSNYDPQVEYDEHNMRLKLDTENSYNDNDISLFDMKDSTYIENDDPAVTSDDNGTNISFVEGSSPTENKTIFKVQHQNGIINLSKHGGLRIGLSTSAPSSDEEGEVAIKGLGLYISSTFEDETPSVKNDEIENTIILSGTSVLPDLNNSNQEEIARLYGKTIRLEQTINNVTYTVYYKYVKDSNGLYSLQQLHDLKSYAVYELPDIKISKDKQYMEIAIDDENINLANVKELGIFTLVDEGKYEVLKSCEVSFEKIRSIEKDYYPIYNPEINEALKPFDESLVGENNHYVSAIQTENIGQSSKATAQKRCRFDIYYNRISEDGEVLAYWTNDSFTNNFKHIGIQLAANCWIPKNALRLNLCSDDKGRQSVFSINLPTINYIHDPVRSEVTLNKDDGFVNFAQIYKKINESIEIKSISISATNRFQKYMKQIRAKDTTGVVSLYVGKIVLYKAESIPIFHPNMRFKIYSENQDNNGVNSSIRKIGAVLEYK